ncbi:MAG TPA: A24 family peptidase [Allosphingosinicella sp.]
MTPVLAQAALGSIAGAIAGSFAATLLVRWPQGLAASRGRSRCDGCSVTLGALELVPVFSYVAQRGRCRHCSAAVDPRHPAFEIAAAVVGAVAFLSAVNPLPGLVSALFGWWLLLIAALDFEHHWLPDRLTLPLIPAGLAVGYAGIGAPLAERMIGAAVAGAGLWCIAWLYESVRGTRGMGGGDPKLFAAIGAWLGWVPLPFVLVGASLFGLAAVLFMQQAGRDVRGTSRLPFGTLLAAAAWPLWLYAVAAEPSLV